MEINRVKIIGVNTLKIDWLNLQTREEVIEFFEIPSHINSNITFCDWFEEKFSTSVSRYWSEHILYMMKGFYNTDIPDISGYLYTPMNYNFQWRELFTKIRLCKVSEKSDGMVIVRNFGEFDWNNLISSYQSGEGLFCLFK